MAYGTEGAKQSEDPQKLQSVSLGRTYFDLIEFPTKLLLNLNTFKNRADTKMDRTNIKMHLFNIVESLFNLSSEPNLRALEAEGNTGPEGCVLLANITSLAFVTALGKTITSEEGNGTMFLQSGSQR
jgi:hypothetical protein